MFILNEKKYIEHILLTQTVPKDLSKGHLIFLMAKYYYSPGISLEEFILLVKEKMLSFDFPPVEYEEYKWHTKITNICKRLLSGDIDVELKERDYIPIYENELKCVELCKIDRQKKLLFTLYAAARYMDWEGWINKKDLKGLSEIFKLANLTLGTDKKASLIRELVEMNYITLSKKIDNLNIKVHLDDSGAILYKVVDFENIGNQYIGNFKKGYKQCRHCGKPIKDTGNKKMYCTKCAQQITRENWSNASLRYRRNALTS